MKWLLCSRTKRSGVRMQWGVRAEGEKVRRNPPIIQFQIDFHQEFYKLYLHHKIFELNLSILL